MTTLNLKHGLLVIKSRGSDVLIDHGDVVAVKQDGMTILFHGWSATASRRQDVYSFMGIDLRCEFLDALKCGNAIVTSRDKVHLNLSIG